jgi:hypothetical protein
MNIYCFFVLEIIFFLRIENLYLIANHNQLLIITKYKYLLFGPVFFCSFFTMAYFIPEVKKASSKNDSCEGGGE